MTKYIVALAIVCGIAAGTSHCDHAKSHKLGGQVAVPAGR
jgi:hypothetical protein